MKRIGSFVFVALLCTTAFADSQFCATDAVLGESLKADPALRQRIDALDAAIGAQVRLRRVIAPQSASSQGYVIPVVVYVVYTSGLPVGTAENITDGQVQSQITALNQAFSAQGITFCLATRDSVTGAQLPGPTQGIIRVADTTLGHTLTNHTFPLESALKGLSTLAGDDYLRIWVVKNIDNGSGVVGYARFPGTVPTALEGVVMRYDVFGDIVNCSGCPLIPNYDRGKVLAHEVGHFLSLYHTFQGGCTGIFSSDCATNGDKVCDTPQIAVADSGCPTSNVISCNGAPALIDNEMDYTNDVCRTSFTNDQTSRMLATLAVARATLVSPQNLVATGVACTGGVNASFSASNYSPCPNAAVTLTALNTSGATYAWDFGDGSPLGSGNPVNHAYASGGPKTVALTVTSGSNSVASSQQIFVAASCAPIVSSQGNWYFGTKAGLKFASGSPVADLNSAMATTEGTVTQSNAAGSLQFYSDGVTVYDRTHAAMNPSTPLNGNSSNTQAAISVPDPSGQNRYYLFTLGPADSGGAHLWYTIVDMTSSNGVLTNTNTAVTTLNLSESITAVGNCSNTGYWIITHQNSPARFVVFSLTASGISGPAFYNAVAGIYGAAKASPDGTMLAQSTLTTTGGPFFPSPAVYDFDRATGAVALKTILTHGDYGVSFSPNSKLLYTSEYPPGFTNSLAPVYQHDLTSQNIDASAVLAGSVPSGFGVAMQLAPDGRIYISGSGQSYLSVINYPDLRDTSLSPNAAGFNVVGPSLQGRTAVYGLPNMIDALPAAQVPATFSSTISTCSTVAFHAPSCASSYAWNFGDSSTSSSQNPTHNYSLNGTYTVTLTLNGSTTVTNSVTIGLPHGSATIYGPATVCLSGNTTPWNYSANSQPGLTYQWTATGGAISGPNTNDNADVAWSTLPGTLQLTVTDPATGCTATTTITVTQNCDPSGCIIPPQPLADWWTFDETSGPVAHDIGGFVDNVATYVGGPVPVPGIVGNGLDFNGTGAHLEVPDSTEVNFYGGCILDFAEPLTIDVWVRTNIPSGTGPTSGLMTLLDKRVAGTGNVLAFGYSLFLFNGRLGFQIDGTNYVAPAAGAGYINIADNQWHFIAVRVTTCRGGADGFLYIDGLNVATLPRALGFVNSAKLYIGERDPAFGANYFQGTLDELEIFKTALSEDQVRAIFEARSHGKCKPNCSQKNIAIGPAALPILILGFNYFPAVTFTGSGGTAPYSFAITAGSLPPGMSLAVTGDLGGSPSVAGVFSFAVTTIDADGCRFTKRYQLVVFGKHRAVSH